MSDGEQKDIGRLQATVEALTTGQQEMKREMKDGMLRLSTDFMNMSVTLGAKFDDHSKRVGTVESNIASMKTKFAIIGTVAVILVTALAAWVRTAWGIGL